MLATESPPAPAPRTRSGTPSASIGGRCTCRRSGAVLQPMGASKNRRPDFSESASPAQALACLRRSSADAFDRERHILCRGDPRHVRGAPMRFRGAAGRDARPRRDGWEVGLHRRRPRIARRAAPLRKTAAFCVAAQLHGELEPVSRGSASPNWPRRGRNENDLRIAVPSRSARKPPHLPRKSANQSLA